MVSAVNNGVTTTAPNTGSSLSPAASAPVLENLNPVAHEVEIIATGAKPGKGEKRELFSETTTTVLVFENGGVIRLDAAVAQGQLIFLTNQENKQEVVAQVTRKRVFRPTSCYVELEFTEPAPGFWGIEFPEESKLVPANAQQAEAEELVRSAEVIGEDGEGEAIAPTSDQVNALKNEVETLREQLKLLQTQATEKQQAPQPAPSESAAALAAEPASKKITPSKAEHQFSEEDLLPKPALNFGQGTQPLDRVLSGGQNAGIGGNSGKVIARFLVAAILFLAVGAAWYMHWIPGLSRTKNSTIGTTTNASHSTNSNLAASATLRKSSDAPASPATAAQTGQTAVTSENPVGQGSAPTGTATAENAQSAPASSPQQIPVENENGSSERIAARPAIVTSVSKRSAVRPTGSNGSVSIAKASEEGTIVPPKLIKSVRPNPPAEALRGYVTGNVALDALIDTTGHVKSMNVISGPQTLRNAAVEALKQYRYEPATQKGRPVPAHVSVTIQFWYEP